MKAILLRNLSKNRYVYLFIALILILYSAMNEKNISFSAFYMVNLMMIYANKSEIKGIETSRRTYPVSLKKQIFASLFQAFINITLGIIFIVILSILFQLSKETIISFTSIILYMVLIEYGEVLSLSQFSKLQIGYLITTLILAFFIGIQRNLSYLDKYFYFLLLGVVLVMINTIIVYRREKNNYYLEGKS